MNRRSSFAHGEPTSIGSRDRPRSFLKPSSTGQRVPRLFRHHLAGFEQLLLVFLRRRLIRSLPAIGPRFGIESQCLVLALIQQGLPLGRNAGVQDRGGEIEVVAVAVLDPHGVVPRMLPAFGQVESRDPLENALRVVETDQAMLQHRREVFLTGVVRDQRFLAFGVFQRQPKQ